MNVAPGDIDDTTFRCGDIATQRCWNCVIRSKTGRVVMGCSLSTSFHNGEMELILNANGCNSLTSFESALWYYYALGTLSALCLCCYFLYDWCTGQICFHRISFINFISNPSISLNKGLGAKLDIIL